MSEKGVITDNPATSDYGRAIDKLIEMSHVHRYDERVVNTGINDDTEQTKINENILLNVETSINRLSSLLNELEDHGDYLSERMGRLQHVKHEVDEAIAYLPTNTGYSGYDNVLSAVYARLLKMSNSIQGSSNEDIITVVEKSVDELGDLLPKF